MKAARVEASRAMSTYTFSAVEARKLAGAMVPMDASQAGEGKLAFTLRRPLGVVGAISPFNFPLNLVAHKIAPVAGGGLRRRAQARGPDTALGAAPGGARGRGRASARVAERGRRPLVGDRRRPRRGRSGEGDHLHRLERRRLEARGALAAEAGQPRARQLDAVDRRGRRRPGRCRRGDGAARLLLRRPELHLDPAGLRPGRRLRRLRLRSPAESRGADAGRPGRRGDRRGAGDRRGRPRPDPGVGRRGTVRRRRDPHRRRPRRRPRSGRP